MYWSISSLFVLMSGEFLLSFIFVFLFLHYRERSLLVWGLSWFFYALGHVFAFWYSTQLIYPLLIVLNQASMIFSGIFLLAGTYLFVGRRMPWYWVVAGVLNLFWLVGVVLWTGFGLSIRTLTFPVYQLLGIAYIWTGILTLRSSNFAGLGRGITGSAFIIWGCYKISLPFLEETWLTPWGYLISWVSPWGFLISMVMTLLVAIGILLAFFQRIGLELQQSEARFRLLTENAQDIIYRIVRHDRLQLEYVSPAVDRILGVSPAELYNKRLALIRMVAPADRKRFLRFLADPELGSETLRWLRRDGETIWMEHKNVSFFDEAGKLTAIEGIARDITERKKNEELMVEARERVVRAERMASLGSMAAGIAHEINQPLNSIKVNADSLIYLDRLETALDRREIMENVQDISRQAARIDEIIRHIRSFIQFDTPVVRQLCDLNAAIASALSLLRTQLVSHDVSLVCQLQPDLPQIEAQTIHLEEIAINLIVNAMQALDSLPGGDKQIVCSTFVDASAVVMEVADNGPGVDEAISDKIFEPFLSTRKAGDSMGLGLFIVQTIVGSHRGRISFYRSELGETVFRVEFPAPNGLEEQQGAGYEHFIGG